jgi:DNA-binding NarL/FixJ family response regulator
VDDEREMCSLLEKVFRTKNISVSFVASNDGEALAKLECADPKPDIVLLDNRLLCSRGVDLAKVMLIVQPSIKIIFLSAEVNAMKEAYAAGAALFLYKPVSIKIITDAVNLVYNSQGIYKYDGSRFTM